MKTFKLDEISAGMKFTEPVYVDDESLLVPAKVEIKEKDLERLHRWGIEEVYSDGDIIVPGKEGGNTPDTEGMSDASDDYIEAIGYIDEVFMDLQEGNKPDKALIEEVVNNLYQLLMERPDELLGPMFQPVSSRHYLSQGAVNCLILSFLMGRRLKLPNHQLANLAVASLLHDSGMMRIPKKILEKSGKLTDEELKTVKAHPVYSFKIITGELGYSEEVGKTALFHHERWDGKGYPKRLKEKSIPLTSRILSVVDAYEAMVSERPYRNSMIGYRAMRQILNDNSRRFDADILKIFIKSMGIYPVGSFVVLNNGSIGRVTENHREIPLRPVVRVLVNEAGKHVEESKQKIVDLTEESSLFIIKAISAKELKEIYQEA
ncbi:MAG: HD-GYP domain-containing protein [Spirochaetaceae bacterium]